MDKEEDFDQSIKEKKDKAHELSQTSSSSHNPEEKEKAEVERKFAGLGNQGATCYMNSLLQALYMSPDFRIMIYRWKYDQSKNASKKDCIIYQLQKLFASLQLIQSSWETSEEDHSLPRYGDTSDLCCSFQWDYKETMQQHDV
jgi:ubiquitin carboxyl-terminal hydrolase 7